jgi:NAD(P)-dependent dehydrogenase (short-subunit alcohol dehydrogenase family)
LREFVMQDAGGTTGHVAGKVGLVTGATSGIGLAIATGLAREGADLTLLVRSRVHGEAAIRRIQSMVPAARLALVEGDLAELSSVRLAAETFLRSHERLDLLVNCAGVFLPSRTLTKDGIETTFATNYLGHFLLTNLVLDAVKRGTPSRIVSVASRYGGIKIDFDDPMFERRKFSTLAAVGQTKLAEILFTQSLAERLQGTGVVANAIHPGLVAHTQLLNQTPGIMRWITNLFGGTPERGADTALWLLTAPENANQSGGLWASRKRMKTPGQGSDPEARRRLWELSERLTGLPKSVTTAP